VAAAGAVASASAWPGKEKGRLGWFQGILGKSLGWLVGTRREREREFDGVAAMAATTNGGCICVKLQRIFIAKGGEDGGLAVAAKGVWSGGGDRKGAAPGDVARRGVTGKRQGGSVAGASTWLLGVRRPVREGVREKTGVMMVSCLRRRGRGGIWTSR
jgi:hypothetical protein